MKRVKEKFYRQNPHLRPETEETLKSGVRITFSKTTRKDKIDKNFGEYIDYEDIKNDKEKTN